MCSFKDIRNIHYQHHQTTNISIHINPLKLISIKTQSYIQLFVVGRGKMGPIPLIRVEPWKAPTRISPRIADRTHIIFSLCGILLSFKQISVFFLYLYYLIDISWQRADILWSWHLGSCGVKANVGFRKINIVLWKQWPSSRIFDQQLLNFLSTQINVWMKYDDIFVYLTKTEDPYIPSKSAGSARCASPGKRRENRSSPKSSVNSRLELKGPWQSNKSVLEHRVLPGL